MSKQDRQGVRTATDLEQKYGFGQSFAEIYGLIDDVKVATQDAIAEFDKELDHEDIFNRLTNYGAIQTIYRTDDGNIYINASYIKSGKLAADLIDAENLKVKGANVTGTLDASQVNIINLQANSITGGTIDAGMVDIINLEANSITAGTLNCQYVTIANFNADWITTGTMSANRIDGGVINGSDISGVDITGCSFYGGTFFAEDGDSRSEMTANQYTIYDEDGNEKVVLEVYPDIGYENTEAARMVLGNSSPAYVEKYYSTGSDHMMWIGNGGCTCGILFNFDTREYRIFGTENTSMTHEM